eukprot:7085333-Prymnesium_polylepis.1
MSPAKRTGPMSSYTILKASRISGSAAASLMPSKRVFTSGSSITRSDASGSVTASSIASNRLPAAESLAGAAAAAESLAGAAAAGSTGGLSSAGASSSGPVSAPLRKSQPTARFTFALLKPGSPGAGAHPTTSDARRYCGGCSCRLVGRLPACSRHTAAKGRAAATSIGE